MTADEYTQKFPKVPSIIQGGDKKSAQVVLITDPKHPQIKARAWSFAPPLKTDLPNFRFDGKCMFTNTSNCGPHRGFGNQQGRFAFEQMMDMAADQVGIDPSDIRLINAVYPGYATPNDWRITTCGLKECIEEVVKKSGYKKKRG